MRKINKIILLLFIGFFYFFSNSILTHILYPLECKGIMPYIVFKGHSYNFIDLNVPHFIAFILIGIVFNAWALLFSIIGELLQVIIKHNQFSIIDVGLNLIGSGVGILIARHK